MTVLVSAAVPGVGETSCQPTESTTETLIVEKPEQEEAPAAGHGHGHGH